MSKHTPGPWRLQDLQPAINAGNVKAGPDGTRFRIYGDSTLWIELVADPDGFVYGENEANARLIAAAPELLEVLKKCDDGLKVLDQDKFGAMRFMIRTTIAKATGVKNE
jgi:hypothetical protein